MPVSLLEDDADWIQTYRDPAIEEEPEVPVAMPGKEPENELGAGCWLMAKKAGAKFPEGGGCAVGVGVRLGRSTRLVTTTSSALKLTGGEPVLDLHDLGVLRREGCRYPGEVSGTLIRTRIALMT